MAWLVPAIHVFVTLQESKTWITGTSPVMTIWCCEAPNFVISHPELLSTGAVVGPAEEAL